MQSEQYCLVVILVVAYMHIAAEWLSYTEKRLPSRPVASASMIHAESPKGESTRRPNPNEVTPDRATR